MNRETYEALKRIMLWVVPNTKTHQISNEDVNQVLDFIDEVAKEYESEEK